jgi:phospholipid transport system substrate-binding protein
MPATAMLDRRRLLLLGLAACLPAATQAQGEPATAFIQGRGEALLAIVNGPGTQAEKRAAVEKLLLETVDVDGVGRFVTGRYWRTASADEQRQFQGLFRDLLVETIGARFGELQGLQFSITGPTRRDEESIGIGTVITRPGQPPAAVEWRVAEQGGGFRVVDLIAEGTSLRLTQRGEYTSVLQRNNGRFGALLQAMQRQLAQLRQN